MEKISIVKKAVNSLKEFGYENCNSENIFTDDIYKAFFKSMINDNIGFDTELDIILNELLAELK